MLTETLSLCRPTCSAACPGAGLDGRLDLTFTVDRSHAAQAGCAYTERDRRASRRGTKTERRALQQGQSITRVSDSHRRRTPLTRRQSFLLQHSIPIKPPAPGTASAFFVPSNPLVPPKPPANPPQPTAKRQSDVTGDFSNAKPGQQIAHSTFQNWVDAYLRPFGEDDLAVLAAKVCLFLSSWRRLTLSGRLRLTPFFAHAAGRLDALYHPATRQALPRTMGRRGPRPISATFHLVFLQLVSRAPRSAPPPPRRSG